MPISVCGTNTKPNVRGALYPRLGQALAVSSGGGCLRGGGRLVLRYTCAGSRPDHQDWLPEFVTVPLPRRAREGQRTRRRCRSTGGPAKTHKSLVDLFATTPGSGRLLLRRR